MTEKEYKQIMGLLDDIEAEQRLMRTILELTPLSDNTKDLELMKDQMIENEIDQILEEKGN